MTTETPIQEFDWKLAHAHCATHKPYVFAYLFRHINEPSSSKYDIHMTSLAIFVVSNERFLTAEQRNVNDQTSVSIAS